jgi:hypothetical protein
MPAQSLWECVSMQAMQSSKGAAPAFLGERGWARTNDLPRVKPAGDSPAFGAGSRN